MKIKVMIIDGVVDTVLADEEALNSKLEVEIVDFDKNYGNREILERQYDEDGISDMPFNIKHCETD